MYMQVSIHVHVNMIVNMIGHSQLNYIIQLSQYILYNGCENIYIVH